MAFVNKVVDHKLKNTDFLHLYDDDDEVFVNRLVRTYSNVVDDDDSNVNVVENSSIRSKLDR